jgi:hypothetical protein
MPRAHCLLAMELALWRKAQRLSLGKCAALAAAAAGAAASQAAVRPGGAIAANGTWGAPGAAATARPREAGTRGVLADRSRPAVTRS